MVILVSINAETESRATVSNAGGFFVGEGGDLYVYSENDENDYLAIFAHGRWNYARKITPEA